jgi:hypothetical protein
MIGMGVRDDRPVHRLPRIDVKIAGLTVEARIGHAKKVPGRHP